MCANKGKYQIVGETYRIKEKERTQIKQEDAQAADKCLLFIPTLIFITYQ